MDISEIIAKRLLGKACDEEIRKLDTWLDANEGHRVLFERLLEDDSFANRMDIMGTIDKDKGWKRLRKRIDMSGSEVDTRVAFISLIAKVAAVILIVVAIGWAVFPKDNRPIPHNLTAEVDSLIVAMVALWLRRARKTPTRGLRIRVRCSRSILMITNIFGVFIVRVIR